MDRKILSKTLASKSYSTDIKSNNQDDLLQESKVVFTLENQLA